MRRCGNLCGASADEFAASPTPPVRFALVTGAHRLAPAMDTLRRALCVRPEYEAAGRPKGLLGALDSRRHPEEAAR